MRRVVLKAFVLFALWLTLACRAVAHEGPPFPIVMDRRVGPYTISVWTDPDVGIGRFFVIVSALPDATKPDIRAVTVCVEPATGRLEEACYKATRQDARDSAQFYAEVNFDRQEFWHVRVTVEGPAGSAEVTADVEATPPGFGPWDLLFYGFPFLMFGGLWAYFALRRRLSARPAEPVAPIAPQEGVRDDGPSVTAPSSTDQAYRESC